MMVMLIYFVFLSFYIGFEAFLSNFNFQLKSFSLHECDFKYFAYLSGIKLNSKAFISLPYLINS